MSHNESQGRLVWKCLVFILCVLSILDLELTIYEIEMGIAYEFNSFMARLLEMGYLPFILAKTNITLLACVALWVGIDKKIAKIGVIFCCLAYFSIFLYHITGLLLWS